MDLPKTLKLSRHLLNSGEYRKALPILGKLTRQAGEHRANAFSNMAAAHYYLGHFIAAEMAARSSIALDPLLASAHLNHGNALFALGRFSLAAEAYKSALRLSPSCPLTINAYCLLLADQGEEEKLQHFLDDLVIQLNPDDQDHKSLSHIFCNLSAKLFAKSQLTAANSAAAKAIFLDPILHSAHLNLANTLYALRAYDEAHESYKTALLLAPYCHTTLSSYVSFLAEQGKRDEHLELLSKWINLAADNHESLYHLGCNLAYAGRDEDSAQALTKALALDPTNTQYSYQLARMLLKIGHYHNALSVLIDGHKKNPDDYNLLSLLGMTYWSASYIEDAILFLELAAARQQDDLMASLNSCCALPIIPMSSLEINLYRQRLTDGLYALMAKEPPTLSLNNEAFSHCFYLAYHNHDDKSLLELYSQLLTRSLKHSGYGDNWLGTRKPNMRASEKIRVGFYSSYFWNHSNAIAFEGLIKNLDRTRFEIVLIHGFDTKCDSTRNRIDSYCDETYLMPYGIQEGHLFLVTLDLDVLFYTDIGMATPDSVMANLRSAPIQVTGWGIPHTSGIDTIDYYLSSDLAEPHHAQDSYSEDLIRLPGLPCCYLSETLSYKPLPREYFFLPPDATLIGSLQALHKFHPDDDIVLEEIAILNPDAVFVICESAIPALTQRYLDRVSESAPTYRDRLHILARTPRSSFLSLWGCMDLLLDPLYYGSGVTFFESSYSGSPILTMEGNLLRNRIVAAGYRKMGITSPPVVHSMQEYVELATQLINDPGRLRRLREEIASKAKRFLYDDMDYVTGFESFLVSAVAAKS
ncbi:MAG: tetratricopeptide repeat protein [Synechococcaceae cyanobacterium ELA445]